MGRQKLNEALEALHEEIGSAGPEELDEESKALLAALGADIARILASDDAGAGDADAERSVLVERLREAVGKFDATHPRLTETVRNLANTLSGMGI